VKRCNPNLVIPPYQDIQLCPVKVLQQYVTVTANLRGTCPDLFISFVKPHKKVTSQTLSRWLVLVLKSAGIDKDKFSAHSFRHASTSKASLNGINTDTILKRVGWSIKSSVFAKFYNRPILDESEFATSVLSIK